MVGKRKAMFGKSMAMIEKSKAIVRMRKANPFLQHQFLKDLIYL